MSHYDPIITFRMDAKQHAQLIDYAKANGLTVSETIRRAIRWMMIISTDKKEMRKK